MKKIVPFLLFIPLFFFVLLLVISQSREQKINKNASLPTQVANISSTIPTVSKVSETESSTQINLIISAPESGTTVDSSSVVVRGTTGKHVNVAINDQDLVSNTDGTFTATVLLDEGDNYISIVAYDDLGNSAEREIMVTRTIEGL